MAEAKEMNKQEAKEINERVCISVAINRVGVGVCSCWHINQFYGSVILFAFAFLLQVMALVLVVLVLVLVLVMFCGSRFCSSSLCLQLKFLFIVMLAIAFAFESPKQVLMPTDTR